MVQHSNNNGGFEWPLKNIHLDSFWYDLILLLKLAKMQSSKKYDVYQTTDNKLHNGTLFAKYRTLQLKR